MAKSYAQQIKEQKEEAKRIERKRRHEKDLAEKEEREKRIARMKSIANIQRESRIKSIELKTKEEEAKRKLKKAKGQSSVSRVLFGKSKKKKHSGGSGFYHGSGGW